MVIRFFVPGSGGLTRRALKSRTGLGARRTSDRGAVSGELACSVFFASCEASRNTNRSACNGSGHWINSARIGAMSTRMFIYLSHCSFFGCILGCDGTKS
jgi:hypothetical protein